MSRDFYDDAMKALTSATIVELENKSVREQVNIFWNAKLVIAVHGAGMANLVSCRPGTHVVEVQPRGSDIPVPEEYKQLSASLGFRYRRTREVDFDKAWNESYSDDGHSTRPQIDKTCTELKRPANRHTGAGARVKAAGSPRARTRTAA